MPSQDHDAGEFDEDAFNELRVGPDGAKDVLIVSYILLRAQYMGLIMQRLTQGHSCWQTIEACLLAVTHVSKEITAWVGQSAKRSPEGSADA